MKPEPYESFSAAGIELKKHTVGKQSVTCPVCSHMRQKHSVPCLSVEVKSDGGRWFCFHCGWSGYIGKNKSYQKRNVYPSRTVTNPSQRTKFSSLVAPSFKPITTLPISAYLDPSRYPFNPFAQWALNLGVTAAHLTACGVGTARHGATVFFHRSPDCGEIWFVKCVHYRPDGRRDKDRPNGITTPKGYTSADGYTLPLYCPLPFDRTKKTYLVESEKTAVLCSFFLPAFNWLACAGAKGLTTAKLAQLAGLAAGAAVNVCFDNDAAGIDATAQAVEKLKSVGIRATAKHLTDLKPDAPKGFDLADWIESELDPQKPRTYAPQSTIVEKSVNTSIEEKPSVLSPQNQSNEKIDLEAVETPIVENTIHSPTESGSFDLRPLNGEKDPITPPLSYSENEINALLDLIRPQLSITAGMDLRDGLAFLLALHTPHSDPETELVEYLSACIRRETEG